MEWLFEHLAEIIAAIGAVVAAWTGLVSVFKNKPRQEEIKKLEKKLQKRESELNRAYDDILQRIDLETQSLKTHANLLNDARKEAKGKDLSAAETETLKKLKDKAREIWRNQGYQSLEPAEVRRWKERLNRSFDDD